MEISSKIRSRLSETYAELRAGVLPPVLSVSLYEVLMQQVRGKFDLHTKDVRALMLVSQFEGFSRWAIMQMAGLHNSSWYVIWDRLIKAGYIYTEIANGRGRGGSRPIYLSESGKTIVNEVNRQWASVCLEAIKRKPNLDPLPKKQYPKKCKQIEPFTLGKMD